jgi:hypothetical protein
MELVE